MKRTRPRSLLWACRVVMGKATPTERAAAQRIIDFANRASVLFQARR